MGWLVGRVIMCQEVVMRVLKMTGWMLIVAGAAEGLLKLTGVIHNHLWFKAEPAVVGVIGLLLLLVGIWFGPPSKKDKKEGSP